MIFPIAMIYGKISGKNIYNYGTIWNNMMLSIYYGKDMEHMETLWKNMVNIWKTHWENMENIM